MPLGSTGSIRRMAPNSIKPGLIQSYLHTKSKFSIRKHPDMILNYFKLTFDIFITMQKLRFEAWFSELIEILLSKMNLNSDILLVWISLANVGCVCGSYAWLRFHRSTDLCVLSNHKTDMSLQSPAGRC